MATGRSRQWVVLYIPSSISRNDPGEDIRYVNERMLEEYVKTLKEKGVRGIAYFDRKYLGTAKKEAVKWSSNLTSYDPLLKEIAYTFFHQQHYSHAHWLLSKIAELGGEKIDTAIMKAECEIVIGNNRPRHIITLLRGLEDFVSKTKNRALNEKYVPLWDNELNKAGRHLARVLLCYVAYCDFAKRTDSWDGDIKMDSMIRQMFEMAQKFLGVTCPRVRCIMYPAVRGIFQAFRTKAIGMRGGSKKNKKYVGALCFNYEAWICIKNGLDDDALNCAEEGIKLVKEAYRKYKHINATLYGDLLANKVAALKNLNKPEDANATSVAALQAYDGATDLGGLVTRKQLLKEFRKAGFGFLHI